MRFCLCEAKAAGNTCCIVKAFNNAHVKNTLYIINMLSRRAGKSEEKDEMFLSVQGELRRQYSCGIVKELNEVTGGNRRFFTCFRGPSRQPKKKDDLERSPFFR